ncbi:MAG: M6 family metalloprotease domain-containing protein [Endomicrobiales bacterium]|nr:M6 family metalloprotease domain-containing protein [Endomicrobiales bacterium]
MKHSILKINKILCTASLLLSAFCFPREVIAVPHITENLTGPKEHVRETKQIITSKSGMVKNGISKPTGTKEIAVILVNFESAGYNTSEANEMTQDDLLGFNETFEYLKNYYAEVSYNQLDLEYTFFYEGGSSNVLTGNETPFTLDKSISYYGLGDEVGDGWGLNKLILHGLIAANSQEKQVTSSKYDAVFIAHAGYGNESTFNYGDIWSAFVKITKITYGFRDGVVVPAREQNASTIGVTCHEFGHVLGLPDLYNTSEGSSAIGRWCLMDMGSWISMGSKPAHLSVWCKKYLGWVKPKLVEFSLELGDIDPIQESPDNVYQVNFSETEYLLICFSEQSEYNPSYPGEGILIWHIDEGVIDDKSFHQRFENNSINNYSHNTVDIIPADYSHPSEFPYGDKNDPWPGLKGILISPESYEGTKAEMNIVNISIKSGKASFNITNATLNGEFSVTDVVNYPNPAGNGYFHPKQDSGIITTFVLNFSGVITDRELEIYNIAGEKVQKASKEQIIMNAAVSDINNAIYEYDWDGKNIDGENVAPGVYFYRLEAGDIVKTGKMVIVR